MLLVEVQREILQLRAELKGMGLPQTRWDRRRHQNIRIRLDYLQHKESELLELAAMIDQFGKRT